jgi:hypothetical protein
MANKNEKGLNRGGAGGQEGELGEESKNLDVKQPARGPPDKPGQQRGGMQGGSGKNSDLLRQNQNQQNPNQQNQNQQRGGLRREPDLEDAEKDTGHEVD